MTEYSSLPIKALNLSGRHSTRQKWPLVLLKYRLLMKANPITDSNVHAESDQVTRILKSYGDAIELTTGGFGNGKQPKAEATRHLRILRCVVLLLRLTGPYVPRHVPQLMVLLNTSLRPGLSEAVKLQSLEGWRVLVSALAEHGPGVLASIIDQARSANLRSAS